MNNSSTFDACIYEKGNIPVSFLKVKSITYFIDNKAFTVIKTPAYDLVTTPNSEVQPMLDKCSDKPATIRILLPGKEKPLKVQGFFASIDFTQGTTDE
jgi:hypothetical protein